MPATMPHKGLRASGPELTNHDDQTTQEECLRAAHGAVISAWFALNSAHWLGKDLDPEKEAAIRLAGMIKRRISHRR